MASEDLDKTPQTGESSIESETAEDAPESATLTAQTPNPPRAKGGRVLGSLALLLALAACAASGYLWYRVEVQQRIEQGSFAASLGGDLQSLNSSVAALEKQQEKLFTRQDDISETIDETVTTQLKPLHQKQADLTQSVQKVYETLDRSLDSWALEEVEQLLQIANHSVLLSGNIRMGLTGLELADARLGKQGNPELLEVRRQVSDEISRLKSVKQVDLSGISLRLASMHSAIPDLPLANAPEQSLPSNTEVNAVSKDQDTDWAAAGQELLADLKSLVRIQNISEPAKPLLAPEEKYFLTANLQLMLSGAQLAVLRSDSDTYRANLKQAAEWLRGYFDNENTAVQTMSKELQELMTEDIAPTTPDISGSLSLLLDIKSRMKAQ